MPFVDQARQSFDFLVRDFGFTGPHVETGPSSMALSYTGRHIGVAIEFDVHEDVIDVVFTRLRDGEFPPRYEPGWVYLDRVAGVLGLPMKSGTRLLPQSETATVDRIREEADLLREAAAVVLEGDGSQLERFRIRYQGAQPET
jgi:hypothetical protein